MGPRKGISYILRFFLGGDSSLHFQKKIQLTKNTKIKLTNKIKLLFIFCLQTNLRHKININLK